MLSELTKFRLNFFFDVMDDQIGQENRYRLFSFALRCYIYEAYFLPGKHVTSSAVKR